MHFVFTKKPGGYFNLYKADTESPVIIGESFGGCHLMPCPKISLMMARYLPVVLKALPSCSVDIQDFYDFIEIVLQIFSVHIY